MRTYQIFVNGKPQGTVKTEDASAFVSENYPGVKSKIEEESAEIYLNVGIMDAMRIGNQ
ncbi:hypothetical protein [Paenibacillus sp. 32352]|uniref:hypothetical protein n=1 Tax=Paenibacillus sp. 32352 TaxID=1969111 RepID=UPI0015C4C240|nr:hypothetical protein [Paenibacillus sp. 32352]